MQILNVLTICCAFVLSSVCYSQDDLEARTKQSADLIKKARKELEHEKSDEALATARQAVAVSKLTVHMLDANVVLAEVLIHRRQYDEAVATLRLYYRPGGHVRLDLTLTIAAGLAQQEAVARDVFNAYLIVKEKPIIAQFMSTELLATLAKDRGFEVAAIVLRSASNTSSLQGDLKDIESVKDELPSLVYHLAKGNAFEAAKEYKSAKAEFSTLAAAGDSSWRRFAQGRISKLPIDN